jgi:curved DNA-binding protein CbpA
MDNSSNIRNLNYYQILGVSIDAPKESIRRSWLLLIKKYHPDKMKNLTEEQYIINSKKAIAINSAWDTLKDDKKRYKYDIDNKLRVAKCGICGKLGNLVFKNENVVALCPGCYLN